MDKIPNAFYLALALVFLLAASLTSYSQSGRPPAPPPRPTIISSTGVMQVELPTPVAETPVPLVGGGRELQTLSFTTPDANFERTLVKGAAFTADSYTEHVQTLSDGNRMTRKSTAHIYRDSAGRTRREHELTGPNIQTSDGLPPRLIVINDPVGRVRYVIQTQTGEAQKTILPPASVLEAMERSMGGNAPFSVLMPTSTAHRRMAEGDSAPRPPEPVREKLAAQTIEGVMAEGTRVTLTIPAGEFDNELPMTITHEEWYSPELHMIVFMKHNDPRFGETTFRLTNILRGDPAAELFQLPAGYRVVERNERPIGPRPVPLQRKP